MAFNQMLGEIEVGPEFIAESQPDVDRNRDARVMSSINVLVSSAVMKFSPRVRNWPHGAAETATAVGQTTTTVEEVRQTVLISSQKAKPGRRQRLQQPSMQTSLRR